MEQINKSLHQVSMESPAMKRNGRSLSPGHELSLNNLVHSPYQSPSFPSSLSNISSSFSYSLNNNNNSTTTTNHDFSRISIILLLTIII